MVDLRQILGLNVTDAQVHPYLALFGAEGEGEEGGAGEEDPPEPESNPDPEGSDDDDDDGDDGQDLDAKISKSYVAKLRRENAERRKKEKELQEKLDAIEQKDMSELEKAQSQKTAAEKRVEELETRLTTELTSNRIKSAASDLDFNDPADAHLLLAVEDLTVDDDGIPTTKSIKGALEKLTKSKPYLVKSAGSGDGGAGGDNPPSDRTDTRIKELESQGRVVVGG